MAFLGQNKAKRSSLRSHEWRIQYFPEEKATSKVTQAIIFFWTPHENQENLAGKGMAVRGQNLCM